MAMYENEGYCPFNNFSRFERESPAVSPLWHRAKKLLGHRIGYMVYTKGGHSETNWCSIVDAIAGAPHGSTLGVEVASILYALIPECLYGVVGRKILITDVLASSDMPKVRCLEDSRYLVSIKLEGKDVHIYLFSKSFERERERER